MLDYCVVLKSENETRKDGRKKECSYNMPLRESARTAALREGNLILAAGGAGDRLTPTQRRNKRNYENRKKTKRSRLLIQDTEPRSGSEHSMDFEGSVF
jgi:hypothetical protein